jgi:hypothetical protein
MEKNLAILLVILVLSSGAIGQILPAELLAAPHAIADGDYIGLEPMASDSPNQPDALWYHENSIVVRHGDFILDKNPILIRDGKKEYSASDGGFITYRGRFLTKNERAYVALRPFMSDYMFFPIGPNQCEPYSRMDIYPVKVAENGFWIDGVFYTKQPVAADRLKSLEETLKSEPLSFDGKHPYNRKFRMHNCSVNDLSVLDD